jgi:hypothetical protein
LRSRTAISSDTSSVLNFLNIVKSTGAANTVDGLTFNDNVVVNLGVTSNNTTILTANDIDRLTAAAQLPQMGGAERQGDRRHRHGRRPHQPRRHRQHGLSSEHDHGRRLVHQRRRHDLDRHRGAQQDPDADHDHGSAVHHHVGLAAFDNRVTGVVGASGFLIPAAIPEEIEPWLKAPEESDDAAEGEAPKADAKKAPTHGERLDKLEKDHAALLESPAPTAGRCRSEAAPDRTGVGAITKSAHPMAA